MADQSRYSISRRPKKKGIVFYCQFKNDDGSYTSAKSTGIIDHGRKKDYQQAVKWAEEYLASGAVVTKETVRFETFADGFFEWGGDWATDKKADNKRISLRQCRENDAKVKRYLIPYFKGKRIQAIDDEAVAGLKRWMYRDLKLAAGTRNKVLLCLRHIMTYAARKRLVRAIPLIDTVSNTGPEKPRGSLTLDEAKALFRLEWPDFRALVANRAAAATGARAGELLALRRSLVLLDNVTIPHIHITNTWNESYGLLPTKNQEERKIPLPSIVAKDFRSLLDAYPYADPGPDAWVFYRIPRGTRWTQEQKKPAAPATPMDGREFTAGLSEMLRKIGITEAEQEARNITFHSWRHWFNTALINGNIPLQKVQSVTGHLSDEMSEHYYHASLEDLTDIGQIQEALFAD